jgi:hypothetical protein
MKIRIGDKMKKCDICNIREGETIVNEITICRGCYDKVFQYTFKGNFTQKDVQESKEGIKLYYDTIRDFISFLREDNRETNAQIILINTNLSDEDKRPLKNLFDTINELKVLENKYSLEIFKKSRNCLKKEEHIKIIRMVHDYELNPQTINMYNVKNTHENMNNISIELIHKYLVGCNYLTWEDW